MRKLTLEEFNNKWVYEPDNLDGWSVTTKGDCDDYALTVAWIVAGNSWVRFWINTLLFRTTFHRVHTGKEYHLILKHKGKYIDNITREWRDDHPYKPVFPWVWLPFFVVIKMSIGKLFK